MSLPDYTKGLKILDEEELNGMVADFQEQLDWKEGEIEELKNDWAELELKYNTLDSVHTQMTQGTDGLGLKLSNALAENDRLKKKCNYLTHRLRLKYLQTKGRHEYDI
jgi:chromosome segregation ATPase